MRFRTLGVPVLAAALLVLPALSSAGQKAKKELLPNGTVKSVTASALVVTAKDKDVTFAVDSKTRVVGKGIGTKSKAAAGKPTIVDLVKAGDRVTVTYQTMGSTMQASRIEVSSAK